MPRNDNGETLLEVGHQQVVYHAAEKAAVQEGNQFHRLESGFLLCSVGYARFCGTWLGSNFFDMMGFARLGISPFFFHPVLKKRTVSSTVSIPAGVCVEKYVCVGSGVRRKTLKWTAVCAPCYYATGLDFADVMSLPTEFE